MSSRVKVGDIVTLNNEGLETIFGTTLGLSAMKSVRMRVTEVERASPRSYEVEVDDPEINAYILHDRMFDVVTQS